MRPRMLDRDPNPQGREEGDQYEQPNLRHGMHPVFDLEFPMCISEEVKKSGCRGTGIPASAVAPSATRLSPFLAKKADKNVCPTS
jgi:hypothetical protein